MSSQASLNCDRDPKTNYRALWGGHWVHFTHYWPALNLLISKIHFHVCSFIALAYPWLLLQSLFSHVFYCILFFSWFHSQLTLHPARPFVCRFWVLDLSRIYISFMLSLHMRHGHDLASYYDANYMSLLQNITVVCIKIPCAGTISPISVQLN